MRTRIGTQDCRGNTVMSRIARRNVVPVNQITPLTYRDGVTYIQMLNELSEYVKSILHPSLQHTVDQFVSDVEKQMDKHHDQYVDGVQEFQRIHDAFMSDVNAKLIALNDGAVSDLVQDDTSLLRTTLATLFVDREDFTTFSGQLRNDFDALQLRNTAFQDTMSTYVEKSVHDLQQQIAVLPIELFGYVADDPTTHHKALQEGLNESSSSHRPLKLADDSRLTLHGPITIESNTHLIGSNAHLHWESVGDWQANGNDHLWMMYGKNTENVLLENFTVTFDGGAHRFHRGINITHSNNVTYRGITVDALTRQAGRLPIRDGGSQVGAGFDANGNGLSLLEGTNYVMENCTVKNFGHPYYIGHSENIRLTNLLAVTYRTGMALIHVKNVVMENSVFHTRDMSHLDHHGGMGVLIESTRGHGSTDNRRYDNVVIRDSVYRVCG